MPSSKFRRIIQLAIAAFSVLAPISAVAATADTASNQLQVLAPVQSADGEWSWQLRVPGGNSLAGSWESSGAVFTDESALIADITSQGECRKVAVQSFLAGFETQAELLALGGDAAEQVKSIFKSECAQKNLWQPKASGYVATNGDWIALIPYSQLPAGTQDLFTVRVTFEGSKFLDACRRTWPDGSWSGFDCQPTFGEAQHFTLTVPEHAISDAKLDGPPVESGTFFDQSTYSALKPVNPKALAAVVGASSGLAGVLTVLVSFPTLFLSKAVDDLQARLAAKRRRLSWTNATVSGLWALALFFVAAIIGGFSDPSFGANFKSLRVLITGFLAFVLMDFGRTQITWLATKNHSGQEYPKLTARPFFLLIVLATVVIARVTQIDPAMVFGSVIGLELGSKLAVSTKGRAKLVTVGYTFLLGIMAWLGYSWLAGVHLETMIAEATTLNASFTTWLQMCQVSLGEFLSMIAVSSFSTIPISLLPFAGLGGKSLVEWKRWVWVLVYFIGILGYTIVVVPMPNSWSTPSVPFSIWMGILGVYTVVALVAFAIITAINRRDAS